MIRCIESLNVRSYASWVPESARFVLHIEEMFINTFGRITYIINKLNDNFFTSEFNDIKTRVRKGKIGRILIHVYAIEYEMFD